LDVVAAAVVLVLDADVKFRTVERSMMLAFSKPYGTGPKM